MNEIRESMESAW